MPDRAVYAPYLWVEADEPPALPMAAIGLDADEPPNPEILALTMRQNAIYSAFCAVTGTEDVELLCGGGTLGFLVASAQGPESRSPYLARRLLKDLDDWQLSVVLAALWRDREAYLPCHSAPLGGS